MKELERQRYGGGIVPGKRNKSEGPKVDASLMYLRNRKKTRAGKWWARRRMVQN